MDAKKGFISKIKTRFEKTFDTKTKKVAICVAAALVLFVIVYALLKAFGGIGSVLLSENFESFSGSGFFFEGYTPGVSEYSVEKGAGKDGGSCLKVVSREENDARLSKKVTLRAGKIYKIEADVKATIESGKKGANVSILESEDSSFTFVTNDTWTHVVDYVTVGKTDSYTVALRLGYYGGTVKGEAFFDNVTVTQVSSVPSGAKLVTVNSARGKVTSDAQYNEATYADMRIVSWLILTFAFIGLLIYGLYVRAYDKLGAEYIPEGDSVRVFPNKRYDIPGAPLKTLGNPVAVFIVVFMVALGLRLALSVSYYECGVDVGLFKYWGRVAAENGMSQLYVIATNCDYPPLYAYFLAAVTHLGKLLGASGTGMSMMVKLPSILADIAIAFIIYFAAVKKRYSFGSALFFASIWLFNPVVLVDASCWGQVDSMLALLVILCCISLNGKKYLAAGLFFGLGVMLKPQMIIFLPVLGCVFIVDFVLDLVRRRPGRAFGFMGKLVLGLVTGLVVPCIPFFGMGLKEVELFGKTLNLPWIFSLFLGTIDHYEYATVNNYNIWFLAGQNWVQDSTQAGPFTLYTWGMLFIVLISLATLAVYAVKLANAIKGAKAFAAEKTDTVEKAFHPGLVFLAGAHMFAMVSCFGPRMHERYFFPAVALVLLAAICYHRKGMLSAYGLVSGIGFITVHEIMLGLLVGGSIRSVKNDYALYGDYYWPKLNEYRGWLAAITVIAALAIFAMFMANRALEQKKFSSEMSEPADLGKWGPCGAKRTENN